MRSGASTGPSARSNVNRAIDWRVQAIMSCRPAAARLPAAPPPTPPSPTTATLNRRPCAHAVMIARPDQKKIDMQARRQNPDPRGPGVRSDLRSVNLSRGLAYQPPDFRRGRGGVAIRLTESIAAAWRIRSVIWLALCAAVWATALR